jgi:hypothetical protein
MLLTALMALAIAAPGAEGAGSAAPSTLETFKLFCVPAISDFSAAIAQADAKGWRPPGPRTLADLPGSLAHMKDGQIRGTLAEGGGVFLVFTGRDVAAGNDDVPRANRVCGVIGAQVGSPDSRFREDVTTWAGNAPLIASQDRVVFAVQGSMGHRSDSQAQRDFEAGKLQGVVALSPQGANILIYLIPTQAN